VKPVFFCNTLLALIFSIFISHSAWAQSCGVARTPAIVAYLQYKGAGWEMGWWPGDSRLGLFGGMSVSKQRIESSGKDSTTEIIGTQVYGKLQFRLYDRVALTTTAGLVNGQEFFYTTGLRFNFQVNNKTAIIGEPQVGNRGFNLLVGVAKRF
jgi:hypothetical protein